MQRWTLRILFLLRRDAEQSITIAVSFASAGLAGAGTFGSLPGYVNPGNALKRYIRPAVRSLEIKIGGWHDLRHTLGTTLRKHGWSAKVRADILGHSSLRVTDGVYDHADQDDFREALGGIASELL